MRTILKIGVKYTRRLLTGKARIYKTVIVERATVKSACFEAVVDLRDFSKFSWREPASLRSKRFRGVGEQRKTEERDFALAKLGREPSPSPPPSPLFFRAVILCSQTPRKRLLRKLGACHRGGQNAMNGPVSHAGESNNTPSHPNANATEITVTLEASWG